MCFETDCPSDFGRSAVGIGFDDILIAVDFHGVSGMQFFAATGFDRSIDNDSAGLNQPFGFTAGGDDLGHFEELIEFDKFLWMADFFAICHDAPDFQQRTGS